MILGGAALAGMGARIQDGVTVPLVDGIACGVRLAEALVGLGLGKPGAGSYAAPKGRASVGSRSNKSAIAPVTSGAAIDVPDETT